MTSPEFNSDENIHALSIPAELGNFSVRMSAANTQLYIYPTDEKLNYCAVQDPEDEQAYFLFHPQEELADDLENIGVEVTTREEPDQEAIDLYVDMQMNQFDAQLGELSA